MTDATPVTEHVHECAELLGERLQARYVPEPVLAESVAAVLALVDMPWDEHTEDDGLFREGYETCALDVLDAIATAWGISLPQTPVEM